MSGPFKLKYGNKDFPFKNEKREKNLKHLKKIKENRKDRVTKEDIDSGDLKFYPEKFV